MRIFVTGGTGTIGANFMRTALAHGHQVLNYDILTPAASLGSAWDLNELGHYHLVLGDVADFGDLKAEITNFAPDAVVHLAALHRADAPNQTPGQTPVDLFNTNILGTFNVLEILRRYQGERPNAPQIPVIIPANTLHNAATFMQATQAASDMIAQSWQGAMMQHVTRLVMAPLYGADVPSPVARMIDWALRGNPIPITQAGGATTPWLFVDDLSDILLTLCQAPVAEHLAVAAGNEMIHPMQLARGICRGVAYVSGADPQELANLIIPNTDRPHGGDKPPQTPTATHIGLTPMRDGLLHCIRWHMRQFNRQHHMAPEPATTSNGVAA